MSVGGGVFVTAMMTLYGWPMQNAVATSSGFGPLIAIPGVLGTGLFVGMSDAVVVQRGTEVEVLRRG